MTTDPAKRTDRTARRPPPNQVMELSRNLPLTRSVLRRAVENATPGQLGLPRGPVHRRERQPRRIQTEPAAQTGRIPPSQDPRRLRLEHGRVPHRLGTRTARLPRVHRPSRGPRALRRRGMRHDPPRHRHRHPRLQAGHPRQVLHRLRLIMRLRKARPTTGLDQEGCARSLAQKRSGPLPGRFQSVVCMVSPSRDMSR